MHMILTGENITAQEAAAAGFVAKVFDVDDTVPRAIAYAQQMASFSAPVVAMAKEAVNAGKYMFFSSESVRVVGACNSTYALVAEDLGLKAGLHFESRLYHATFGLVDHREGFDAFLQKRAPQWTHK